MSLEFFGRLQRELSLTGSAVLTNWLSRSLNVCPPSTCSVSTIKRPTCSPNIETVQGHLDVILPRHYRIAHPLVGEPVLPPHPNCIFYWIHAADRVHHLKQTLVQLDAQIRELKLEAIHEDLLKLQRDLSLRAAAIEPTPRCPRLSGRRETGLGSAVAFDGQADHYFPRSLSDPPDRCVCLQTRRYSRSPSASEVPSHRPWFTVTRTAKPA